MNIVLLIVLILLLVGGLPAWPYAATWHAGYWPSGILGIVVLLLVLHLLGLF